MALYCQAQSRRPVGQWQYDECERPECHGAGIHPPGRPPFQHPGERDEGHKGPAHTRACEYIPDALGVKPEPAQGDRREGEEDDQDVVSGGNVAEEEAGEE